MYTTLAELRRTVAARGLKKATLVDIFGDWVIQIHDHDAGICWTLSTERRPGESRKFRAIDPAAAVMREAGIVEFEVMWPEADRPCSGAWPIHAGAEA